MKCHFCQFCKFEGPDRKYAMKFWKVLSSTHTQNVNKRQNFTPQPHKSGFDTPPFMCYGIELWQSWLSPTPCPLRFYTVLCPLLQVYATPYALLQVYVTSYPLLQVYATPCPLLHVYATPCPLLQVWATPCHLHHNNWYFNITDFPTALPSIHISIFGTLHINYLSTHMSIKFSPVAFRQKVSRKFPLPVSGMTFSFSSELNL